MAMREARAEPRVAGREGKASAAVGGWLAGVRTFPQQTKTFLSEVRAETQRVTWPTRKQIRVTTVVVIVTVFFFGLYLFVVDLGVSRLVEQVIQFFKS